MYLDRTRGAGWDYDLILHQTRITPSTSLTQQYEHTFCSSMTNTTRPWHTFVEHKRIAAIIVIVGYLDNTSRWDYDLILHRTQITDSNWRHTPIQTHRLVVQGQHDTVHAFKEHQRTTVIVILVYLYSTSGWDNDLEHKHQLQIQSNTLQYERTSCSSRANTTSSHNFNEHKHISVSTM